MVLSSQVGRPDLNRRYMTGRRRRRGGKGKFLLLLLIIGGLTIYYVTRDDSEPADDLITALPEDVHTQTNSPSSLALRPDAGSTNAPSASPGVPSFPSTSQQAGVNTHRGSDTRSPAQQQQATRPQAPEPTAPPVATPTTPPAASPTTTTRDTRPGRNPQPTTPAQGTAQAGADAQVSTSHPELATGMELINRGELVQGRAVLSRLLTEQADALSRHEAQGIRDTLSQVNQRLIFSPTVVPGDPLVDVYQVQSGDRLVRVTPRYHVTHELIELINGVDARRIQVGQRLKMIRGPFHAVVHKSEYRMDLFLLDLTGSPIYIRSFAVGLGEENSTPPGSWIITPGSKVKNPAWTNPRTNEHFQASDPNNPIGRYWMGMQGLDPDNEDKRSYGIHGTIEPDSIGQQASMGCIRLRDDDIALLFNLLVDGQSIVQVQP